MDDEELLRGGNTSGPVVRIGSTVRKLATPGTSGAAALLAHLHQAGFSGAPRTLGSDDQGRWVLEYIPGTVGHDGSQLSLADLRRAGQIIREFHDASSSFPSSSAAKWNIVMPCPGSELICHNDLAPWNLVRGPARWAFIDWDNAAPGTRLWDLGYATLTFPPFVPGCDLEAAAMRACSLLKGYGLSGPWQALFAPKDLVAAMVHRAAAMASLLTQSAVTGQQPWAALAANGHTQYWSEIATYLDQHRVQLAALLLQQP